MNRSHLAMTVLLLSLPTAGVAQTLSALRLDGPSRVFEERGALYRAVAEFDNGWEFDVTLDASLWVDPGQYASVGVFGDLLATSVDADEVETLRAWYNFGTETRTAALDVEILDLPPAGLALDFDGADDFVQIPRAESLEPDTAMTIECWARGRAGSGRNAVMVRKALGHDAGFVLRWQFQSDPHIYFQAATTGLDEEVWVVDPTPNQAYLDEWHHFAGVYAPAEDAVRLYVDGKLVAEEPALSALEHSGDLWFGNTPGTSGEAFRGQLDEIRMWGVPRTECEIASAKSQRLDGSEQGILGIWHLDEGQGQDVSDSSSFGTHGVLGVKGDPAGDAADPAWVISGATISGPGLDPGCPLIAFTPGSVLSCYADTPVYEYDRRSGSTLQALSIDVDSPFLGKFNAEEFLYLTDRDDDEVLVFAPDGARVNTWPTGPGTQGIDIGPTTQRVYVATTGAAKVYEMDGTPYGEIPYSESFGTTDIAVDEDRGRIYLSTLHWPGIVYVADMQGNEIDRWDGANGVSDSPWGIDVGRDGTVYVGIHHQHKVVAISPTGKMLWEAGSADLPSRVSEVEVAPNGEVWVQEEDRQWIARFAPDGMPLPRFDAEGPAGYMIAWVPNVFDLSFNGTVDLADFGQFQPCMLGPAVLPEAACQGTDFAGTSSVDLLDFAAFQRAFDGP